MDPWFTVVIPTRDSAMWIGTLLSYYESYGIKPIFLLDARTTDNTESEIRKFGCEIVLVKDFKFTEGIVSLTRQCVRTPWTLFLHDDEAPSRKLVERLRGLPPSDAVQSVAIPRRWGWYSPGCPLSYGETDLWPDRTGRPGMDHAWRLFRAADVRFIDTVHTEGFVIEKWARFEADTFFVHFEWVLRTYAQRLVKLRAYDRYRFGYGLFFEKVYLPETLGPEEISYRVFEDDRFDTLALAYFKARKNEVEIPNMNAFDYYQRIRHKLKGYLSLLAPDKEPRDRQGLTPLMENELPL